MKQYTEQNQKLAETKWNQKLVLQTGQQNWQIFI